MCLCNRSNPFEFGQSLSLLNLDNTALNFTGIIDFDLI